MPEYNKNNPYIVFKFAGDYFIDTTKSVIKAPKMINGSKPTDDGNLIIEAEDYEDFIKNEPAAKKYIRRYIGAREFINNLPRYCLWLVDCPPDELRKMKLVYERVKAVREFRLKSKDKDTVKDAEKPNLFQEIRQPKTDYLCVPRHSSETRRYIPIEWMNKDVIAGDAVQCIPDAALWLFGQLESCVHMAWVRAVGGRIRNDYRYSAQICYNPFPFINADKKRFAKIESTAQKILDARANYPNANLADLYDEVAMPTDLRKAHNENDAAVMDAYGYPPDFNELQIVQDLLLRYEAMAMKIPECLIMATSRRNFKN